MKSDERKLDDLDLTWCAASRRSAGASRPTGGRESGRRSTITWPTFPRKAARPCAELAALERELLSDAVLRPAPTPTATAPPSTAAEAATIAPSKPADVPYRRSARAPSVHEEATVRTPRPTPRSSSHHPGRPRPLRRRPARRNRTRPHPLLRRLRDHPRARPRRHGRRLRGAAGEPQPQGRA